MSDHVHAARTGDARGPSGFWASRLEPRALRRPQLPEHADVVVVGAGYTGLWTALHLLEREPSLRVVVLEADRVGAGASGRNGGWLDPSLIHGVLNGERHFPGEIEELERLAEENLRGFCADLEAEGIRCELADAVQRGDGRPRALRPRLHGTRRRLDALCRPGPRRPLLAPDSPLLALDYVRRPALPFPPEPVRWLGIQLTRRHLAREDATGRRSMHLHLLDRLGVGFDS